MHDTHTVWHADFVCWAEWENEKTSVEVVSSLESVLETVQVPAAAIYCVYDALRPLSRSERPQHGPWWDYVQYRSTCQSTSHDVVYNIYPRMSRNTVDTCLQVALLQSARPALAQIFSVADSLRRNRINFLLMGNAARCATWDQSLLLVCGAELRTPKAAVSTSLHPSP